MEIVTLTLAALVISVVTLFILTDVTKPKGYPPGPAWLPLLGCYLQIRSALTKLGQCQLVWAELAREYGPLVGLRLGRERVVLVSGHEAVNHVLSREDCDDRLDVLVNTFDPTVVDDEHGTRASTSRDQESGIEKAYMEKNIITEVEMLVKHTNDRCTESGYFHGTIMSLHDLCNVHVVNAVWAVVSGKRFELVDGRLNQLTDATSTLSESVNVNGGTLNYLTPILRFIAPEKRTGYQAMKKGVRVIQQLIKDSIAEHKTTTNSSASRDLIDVCLHMLESEKEDNTITEQHVLSLCMELFLGCVESANNALGFLMLYLLRRPDVQNHMHNQLDLVVGRKRLPTLADRPLLPYVEAVIMEVQRLSIVSPATLPHKTTKDCEILGYRIPKDTTLIPDLHSVLMDPKHWDDPETFRPERFLDKSRGKIIHDEWFIPFGLGKYRNLDESLARDMIFLFLTSLLQNFSFDLEPEQELPSLQPSEGTSFSPRPFTGIVTKRYFVE